MTSPSSAAKSPLAGDPLCSKIKGYATKSKYTGIKGWHWFKPKCKKIFQRLCDEDESLDYSQAEQFFKEIGEQYFDRSLVDLLNEDIFDRFDFDGDGYWQFLEAFKAVKRVLEVQLHVSGLAEKEVDMITPKEKGITQVKLLAKGGQGEAWLAKSKKYGDFVLKRYDKQGDDSTAIEEVIEELAVSQKVESPYIMKAYEIFQDQRYLYCCNELLPGGDFESLRKNAAKQDLELDEGFFVPIFRQCLQGVAFMHSRAFMHCDIKEPNIMLKTVDLSDPKIAIIDLGLAAAVASSGKSGGTSGYIPPETWQKSIWYPQGDIFAMGVTFFQLLADKVPDDDTDTEGIFQEGARYDPNNDQVWEDDVRYFTETRPVPTDLIEHEYPGTLEWLPSMMEKQRRERPTAQELLDEYDWFEYRGGKCSACVLQ